MIIRRLLNKLHYVFLQTANCCYEWYMRVRLKNRNFTILCSNCIGGIIYHRLGQEFRSPTVNMWLHQQDFLKLAENIQEYMQAELNFQEGTDYPIAKLNDITLYFNHSTSEKEARADWNRRKERICYDNLFIIMYDCEDITREDILRLEKIPCRNRLVLSNKFHPDIPYVKTIRPTPRLFGEQCIDRDWLGFRTFEKHFDYTKWLNSGVNQKKRNLIIKNQIQLIKRTGRLLFDNPFKLA